MSHDCKRVSTDRAVALKEAKDLRHTNARLRALLSDVVSTVQFSNASHHQDLLADIRQELSR